MILISSQFPSRQNLKRRGTVLNTQITEDLQGPKPALPLYSGDTGRRTLNFLAHPVVAKEAVTPLGRSIAHTPHY